MPWRRRRKSCRPSEYARPIRLTAELSRHMSSRPDTSQRSLFRCEAGKTTVHIQACTTCCQSGRVWRLDRGWVLDEVAGLSTQLHEPSRARARKFCRRLIEILKVGDRNQRRAFECSRRSILNIHSSLDDSDGSTPSVPLPKPTQPLYSAKNLTSAFK